VQDAAAPAGSDEADGLAVGKGGVWTANGLGQTVARINPTPTGNK